MFSYIYSSSQAMFLLWLRTLILVNVPLLFHIYSCSSATALLKFPKHVARLMFLKGFCWQWFLLVFWFIFLFHLVCFFCTCQVWVAETQGEGD